MLRGGCWLDVLHYILTGEQKNGNLHPTGYRNTFVYVL